MLIYKKLTILTLLLWLIGAAGMGWCLKIRSIEKQILCEKKQITSTKLEKVGQVFENKSEGDAYLDNIQSITEAMIKGDWPQGSAKQDNPAAIKNVIFTGSAVCIVVGLAITIFVLLRYIVTRYVSKKDHRENTCLNNHDKAKSEKAPSQQDKKQNCVSLRDNIPTAKEKFCSKGTSNDVEKIAEIYRNKMSLSSEENLNTDGTNTSPNTNPLANSANNIYESILSGYKDNTQKLEDSLKTQTENFEKQVSEFRQITQIVKDATLERSNPINSTLEELNQQVSAIREYATNQQGKMQKLQEGYDWNIIRTFCLRIIRCIDNLESRIKVLSENDIATTDLEQIMDELIFALESSGVEQFEPEIHSDYSGQEKLAEVIKDKQSSQNPDMKSKIAEIIKPGYHYMIDDNNVKIVRVARVKLFG